MKPECITLEEEDEEEEEEEEEDDMGKEPLKPVYASDFA